MQNKYCRVGSAVGCYTAMQLWTSLWIQGRFSYTLYTLYAWVYYWCQVAHQLPGMLAKSQNEKHITNGNLQVPHQLTRILAGLSQSHVINTTNPPSDTLFLHNLWGWVGGGRVKARVWHCANNCYRQTINQWTMTWHKGHCSIWVVVNQYRTGFTSLARNGGGYKSYSDNALPSTTSFLLCNLAKAQLQHTYGHEAASKVVKDKQRLPHHLQY